MYVYQAFKPNSLIDPHFYTTVKMLAVHSRHGLFMCLYRTRLKLGLAIAPSIFIQQRDQFSALSVLRNKDYQKAKFRPCIALGMQRNDECYFSCFGLLDSWREMHEKLYIRHMLPPDRDSPSGGQEEKFSFPSIRPLAISKAISKKITIIVLPLPFKIRVQRVQTLELGEKLTPSKPKSN